MATIKQHVAARNDSDLLQRFVAAAEKAGIATPQQWVEANRGTLVSVDVDGTTVADVHAYAVATYEPLPRPGEDDAKILDSLLVDAVEAVKNPVVDPEPTPEV